MESSAGVSHPFAIKSGHDWHRELANNLFTAHARTHVLAPVVSGPPFLGVNSKDEPFVII
jgi:hypothetical protein